MKILGHRGVILPESGPYQNTMQAYELALEHCDGFEVDAVISSDNVVFLAHDVKVEEHHIVCSLEDHLDEESRAKCRGRRIDQMLAAEVRQLCLKDGQPIPELSEALELVKSRSSKYINIELKGYDVYKGVLDCVRSSGISHDQIMISSFDHQSLVAVRKALPEVSIGMIFSRNDQPATRMYPWQPEEKIYYLPAFEENFQNRHFDKIKPDYIILPHTALMPSKVAFLKKELPDLKVGVWMLNTSVTEMQGMAQQISLSMIMVDTPEQMEAARNLE